MLEEGKTQFKGWDGEFTEVRNMAKLSGTEETEKWW